MEFLIFKIKGQICAILGDTQQMGADRMNMHPPSRISFQRDMNCCTTIHDTHQYLKRTAGIVYQSSYLPLSTVKSTHPGNFAHTFHQHQGHEQDVALAEV
jgi:hypothetical protein